jgi:hypothetical protein
MLDIIENSFLRLMPQLLSWEPRSHYWWTKWTVSSQYRQNGEKKERTWSTAMMERLLLVSPVTLTSSPTVSFSCFKSIKIAHTGYNEMFLYLVNMF